MQRLQVARQELALESAIRKLDRYDLLILDDIAYVTKDQAETSVLFELIAPRYERRSLLITANQPFGEWGKIFSDQAMTWRRSIASFTTPPFWRRTSRAIAATRQSRKNAGAAGRQPTPQSRRRRSQMLSDARRQSKRLPRA